MSTSSRPGRPPTPRRALLGLLAALASGATALLILRDQRLAAGAAAAVAAATLLFALPRPRDRMGIFAGHLLDLLFEGCVLVPLVWAERFASPRVAVLALVGVGTALVATYERAKGRGLGYRTVEGWPYRAACEGLLVLGLLTGWLEAALWGFVVLTGAAAAVRAYNVARQERHRKAVAGGRV
jgi:hypothetical protein